MIRDRTSLRALGFLRRMRRADGGEVDAVVDENNLEDGADVVTNTTTAHIRAIRGVTEAGEDLPSITTFAWTSTPPTSASGSLGKGTMRTGGTSFAVFCPCAAPRFVRPR